MQLQLLQLPQLQARRLPPGLWSPAPLLLRLLLEQLLHQLLLQLQSVCNLCLKCLSLVL